MMGLHNKAAEPDITYPLMGSILTVLVLGALLKLF